MNNLSKRKKETQNFYEPSSDESNEIDIPYKKEDIDQIVGHRPKAFLRNSLKKSKVKKLYPDALSIL